MLTGEPERRGVGAIHKSPYAIRFNHAARRNRARCEMRVFVTLPFSRFGFLAVVFLFTVSPCPADRSGLHDSLSDQAGNQPSKVSQGKTNPSKSLKHGPQAAKKDRLHLYGKLAEGGAECQRFRASDNSYYTLEGDLRGFRTGDTVEITGVIPKASHCMQDTTVRVETIRRDQPPKSKIGNRNSSTTPRRRD